MLNNLITLVGLGWETQEDAIFTLIENRVVTKKQIEQAGGNEPFWQKLEKKYQFQLANKVIKNMALAS